MKSLRGLIGIILALALAAFGAPALAQTKIYSLTLPTSSVAPGQTAEIVATFKNETPNGNSSFNSIQGLKVTGPLSIVGVRVPNGGVQPSPIPAAGVKSINITSMSPVKNGQTFAVTLTVKADSAVGCTNSSATWTVDNVWTGSALSGNTFARIPAGSAWPTTTVTGGACSLSFAPAPADALTNQSITSSPFSDIGPSVKVKAVNGSNQPVSGVPVRLEKSGGLCTIASTSYVTTDANGLAAFSGLASTAAGGCTLTATTTQPNVTAASASFNIVEGTLKIAALPNPVISPQSVTVSLVNAANSNATIPVAGTVNLTGDCAPGTSGRALAGTVTFNSLAFRAGTCALGATGTFAGLSFATVPATSAVSVATITTAGSLECLDTVPAQATFNASINANDALQTDWAAGYRGPSTKGGCPTVGYQTTNNIVGPSGTVDAKGFVLPSNAFSIVFDDPLGLYDVVLSYTLTFQAELSGSNGQPDSTKTVKYCKQGTTGNTANDKNCALQANQVELPGCLNPDITLLSIPPGHPACQSGLAWSTVAPSECSTAPTGDQACIRVTIKVTDGKDPPIIR